MDSHYTIDDEGIHKNPDPNAFEPAWKTGPHNPTGQEGIEKPDADHIAYDEDGKPYCTHCKQRIRGESPHSLGTGLIYNLVLMAKATKLKGSRELQINKDLPELLGAKNVRYENLSNTSNLRFFGLVAKVKRPDGSQIKNTWLITKRGWEFLRGQTEIPAKVWTKDNHITRRDERMVTIHDFKGLPMQYPQREDTRPEDPQA